MKYTKIITSLFLAAAFMLSTSAMAADKEKGKGKGGRGGYAALGLSKEQMGKLKELNKTRMEAMKKARDAKDRDGMKAAQKSFNDSLAKVLDEEQLEKWKKMQAERAKGRSKGGQKGGKGKDKKKKKDS